MTTQGAYPPIGEYGLIGDMHSCALISRDGSIDWCCFPRFDSRSVFGRLLDWERGGHFQIRAAGVQDTTRRYLPGTNVLETTFHTDGGSLRLTDFMPVEQHSDPLDPRSVVSYHQVGRIAECTSGEVQVDLICEPRFDYGAIRPHVSLLDEFTGFAHGGADAIALFCSAPLERQDGRLVATATLRPGERLEAAVTYEAGFGHRTEPLDARTLTRRLEETIAFWQKWCGSCHYDGPYEDQVLRSALTLKALTYAPTGALLAAATTSLPETVGGRRNWDYRFTWVRDATFAVYALSLVGMREEARHFKEWLEWSTAGRAADLQVLYGVAGERRLTEIELPRLRGYRDSRPVRIGNGAADQFQLDIYGELLDSAHLYRRMGGQVDEEYWDFLREVVDFVIDHWREPDEGIWETRSDPEHFVFSKVMCWVALDRAIRAARELDLPGDVERWRRVRAEIREEVLQRGYDESRGAFMQSFGSPYLDASVLMLPLFGFIRAEDPRMRSTIEVIERELTSPEGFVYRYRGYDDGVGGDEGTFNICSFWLCDNLILLGELDRARALLERLMHGSNDLGLMSEQINLERGMLGNFPQAFSHLGLINAVTQLKRAVSEPGSSPPQLRRPAEP